MIRKMVRQFFALLSLHAKVGINIIGECIREYILDISKQICYTITKLTTML